MLVLKKFKDIEGVVKIEEVDGQELVKKFAEEMEEMLGRKMKSMKVVTFSYYSNHFDMTAQELSVTSCVLSQRLAEAAEDADLYHEYNETLEVCDHMRTFILVVFRA